MAATGWAVNYDGVLYPAVSIEFTRQVDSLDSAIVDIQIKIPIKSRVTLVFNGSTFMGGEVSSCNRVSAKTYSILVSEDATVLKTQLTRTSVGNVSVEVANDAHDKTIHDYVAAILGTGVQYGSGYVDGTNDLSLYVPNTTNFLPNMQFTSVYRLDALDKFLKNTCGLMYWFDYTQKIIFYGEFRYDRTGYNLEAIDVREKRNTVVTEYTEVIVYGQNMGISGTAVTGSAPYKTVQYQYLDYADVDELQRIAEQLLRDKSPQGLRYEVDMTIQRTINLALGPGDKVRVQWAMEGIDEEGIIRDINYNGDIATLGIGDKEVNAFDLLSDKLQQIQGASLTGSQMVYSGGWQNIDDGTVAASWVFQVMDVSKLSQFKLFLDIDHWKTQAEIAEGNADVHVGTGYANTHVAADSARNVTGTGSANVVVGVGKAVVSNAYLPSISYIYGGQYGTLNQFYIPQTAWQSIIEVQVNGIAEGVYFAVATLNLSIQDWWSPGWRWLTMYVYQVGVGDAGYQIDITKYCQGPDADQGFTIWDLQCSTLIKGWNQQGTSTFRFYLVARNFDANGACVTGRIEYISRHTHTAADTGHSDHPSPDNGHSDHTITDTGHPHGAADWGHAQAGSDSGHIHDGVPTTAQLAGYPTSIDVWIYNDKYPTGHLITGSPFAGGSKSTISIGDITALLSDGPNEIVVYSDTVGSGWLNGTFISYGE